MTLLSFFAILLLPRQFHVTVVENNDEREIRRAALAVSALSRADQPVRGADRDRRPADLPGRRRSTATCSCWRCRCRPAPSVLTIVAFVGGLSAATAMVIVETVALAIMVSNDIVVPLVLQRREALITGREDVGALLLTVRRLAIFAILLLAYIYYRFGRRRAARLDRPALLRRRRAARAGVLRRPDLAARHRARRHRRHDRRHPGLGLYAAAAELRRRRHRRRATSSPTGRSGIAWLRPQALFGLDLPPLVHGVVWSLALNILAYVGFSLRARAERDRAAAGRPVRAVASSRR